MPDVLTAFKWAIVASLLSTEPTVVLAVALFGLLAVAVVAVVEHD